MTIERNKKIKNYITGLFVKEDAILQNILKISEVEKIPNIQVPPKVGKLIYCLASVRSPKRILEIGTLIGYSTIWLARALASDGKMISLEKEEKHAALAKKNLADAGLQDKVEIQVGDASQLLLTMIAKQVSPFDLIFIDADKENYPNYLDLSLQLATSGTLILSDNLIPKGEDIGSHPPGDQIAKNIYEFNKKMAGHPRLEAILLPTIVGEEGRIDALGIAKVL